MSYISNNPFAHIVVLKRTGQDGASFPMTSRRCRFGRAQDCDIRLQLRSVSNEHCEIIIDEEGKAYLKNLSSNGVTLKEKHVSEKDTMLPLHNGDVFVIEERAFRFEYSPVKNQMPGTPTRRKTPLRINQASPENVQNKTPTKTPTKKLSNESQTPQKKMLNTPTKQLLDEPVLVSNVTAALQEMIPTAPLTPRSHQKRMSFVDQLTASEATKSVLQDLLDTTTVKPSTPGAPLTPLKRIEIMEKIMASPQRSSFAGFVEQALAPLKKEASLPENIKVVPLDQPSHNISISSPVKRTPKKWTEVESNSPFIGSPIKMDLVASPIKKTEMASKVSSPLKRAVTASPVKNISQLASPVKVSGNVKAIESPMKVMESPSKSLILTENASTPALEPMKRVTFGPDLSPEIFDKSQPPASPLKRGRSTPAVPVNVPTSPVAIPNSPKAILKAQPVHVMMTPSRLRHSFKPSEDFTSPVSVNLPSMDEEMSFQDQASESKEEDDDETMPMELDDEVVEAMGPSGDSVYADDSDKDDAIHQRLCDRTLAKLQRLATPLRQAIEKGSELKNKFADLPSMKTPLKKDIAKGIELKNKLSDLPAMKTPLKKDIAKGVELKSKMADFPSLETPLKKDIAKGVELKDKLADLPSLETPLKEDIAKGVELKSKLSDLPTMKTPLKKDIAKGVELKNKLADVPTMETPLKKDIAKGVELKSKLADLPSMATPLKKDIAKGVELKSKFANVPTMETPLKNDIAKGVELKSKVADLPVMEILLKEEIAKGVELKSKFSDFPKLANPLKEEIELGIILKQKLASLPCLNAPLKDEIMKGLELRKVEFVSTPKETVLNQEQENIELVIPSKLESNPLNESESIKVEEQSKEAVIIQEQENIELVLPSKVNETIKMEESHPVSEMVSDSAAMQLDSPKAPVQRATRKRRAAESDSNTEATQSVKRQRATRRQKVEDSHEAASTADEMTLTQGNENEKRTSVEMVGVVIIDNEPTVMLPSASVSVAPATPRRSTRRAANTVDHSTAVENISSNELLTTPQRALRRGRSVATRPSSLAVSNAAAALTTDAETSGMDEKAAPKRRGRGRSAATKTSQEEAKVEDEKVEENNETVLQVVLPVRRSLRHQSQDLTTTEVTTPVKKTTRRLTRQPSAATATQSDMETGDELLRRSTRRRA